MVSFSSFLPLFLHIFSPPFFPNLHILLLLLHLILLLLLAFSSTISSMFHYFILPPYSSSKTINYFFYLLPEYLLVMRFMPLCRLPRVCCTLSTRKKGKEKKVLIKNGFFERHFLTCST
uniref:Uncharacterized protein n=1 Tax=Cacopsylla melanoneura TaxID=428564 RepID=A0A8D9FID2_9HEMI